MDCLQASQQTEGKKSLIQDIFFDNVMEQDVPHALKSAAMLRGKFPSSSLADVTPRSELILLICRLVTMALLETSNIMRYRLNHNVYNNCFSSCCFSAYTSHSWKNACFFLFFLYPINNKTLTSVNVET